METKFVLPILNSEWGASSQCQNATRVGGRACNSCRVRVDVAMGWNVVVRTQCGCRCEDCMLQDVHFRANRDRGWEAGDVGSAET